MYSVIFREKLCHGPFPASQEDKYRDKNKKKKKNLLKTQDRSQLLGKSHRHIRLHATIAFHRRCSVFVLDGYGSMLRLRFVSEIKEKIDWFRQNSFTDQCFISSLKFSFRFVKYLTHDVL